MEVWSATLELRNDPNFYGGQQWGILSNERKLDSMISHIMEKQQLKVITIVKIMIVTIKKSLQNFVPAAAVIQKGRALFMTTGRKTCVDC
jgi:hypothetical protein